MRKPRVCYTIADKKHEWMLKPFTNSLRKFHSEKDLPLIVIDDAKCAEIKDPAKFYRMTPLIAEDLIKEYELVIKMDCDQIVTGDLSSMFNGDYDVGTVYNWNRVDPPIYGEVGLCTIQPMEYYNCGLVAMRSPEFINHWWNLCNSPHFERMPMREQGFLNILAHYGKYKVRCFDDPDVINGVSAWWGLRSKGEWNKIVLKDDKLILPVGIDGYPEENKIIKVLHWAGGENTPKLNYQLYFTEDCIKRLDYLTGDKK